MTRRRVVCFINHTAETGGAEFALFRLVAAMDRRSWHPVVLFGEDGAAVDYLRSKSVECYVLPLEQAVGKARRKSLNGVSFSQSVAAFKYVLRLVRFLKDRAVEIVHTNSMKAHVLGGVAARIAGIPLVWHLRDSLHLDCLPERALKAMRFLARNLPDRLVTVSRSVAADALGQVGADRARVVYDGLESSFFEQPSKRTGGNPGRCLWRVGMVGRFSRWKGQHLFLQAAESLLARGVPVEFEVLGGALFGEDEYAAELTAFVSERGLGEKIVFKGFVADVRNRIRSWDVLVHASTAPDPCPNVVIEAMASHVPVVGAASGGVPELLEDGRCGVLFPMNDPESLSICIEGLLRDGAKREKVAQLAYERSFNLFRAERVAREVEEEWTDIFDERVYANRRWAWLEDGLPERSEGIVARQCASKRKQRLQGTDFIVSNISGS